MSEDKRSRYSRVYRRMWNDARFMALTAAPPNGQTLFQRLLTGPELTNIPGVFAAGEAGLAEALGWPLEGFREAFGEVSREGLAKADWKARFVFVPKAIRHSKPESPNVVRSWKTAWDELPECSLKVEAFHAIRTFVEGLGKAFAEAFAEACPDPSPNQDQDQDQDKERAAQESPTTVGASVPVLKVDKSTAPSDPPPSGAKPKSVRGTRLDPSWHPSPESVARLRTKHKVDPLGSLERFQNYWIAKAGKDAVKLDWERTFATWVDRDAGYGNLPRIAVEDELPILRLPNRDALLRDDLRDDAPDFTAVTFGATK